MATVQSIEKLIVQLKVQPIAAIVVAHRGLNGINLWPMGEIT